MAIPVSVPKNPQKIRIRTGLVFKLATLNLCFFKNKQITPKITFFVQESFCRMSLSVF